MYIAGDQLRGGSMQTIDTQNMSNSVIERNKSIITKFPLYNRFHQNWRIGKSVFIVYVKNIK